LETKLPLNIQRPVSGKKHDFLSDSQYLEKLAHDVEKLENTVQAFDKKSLNGPTNLDLKWKDVVEIQACALFYNIANYCNICLETICIL